MEDQVETVESMLEELKNAEVQIMVFGPIPAYGLDWRVNLEKKSDVLKLEAKYSGQSLFGAVSAAYYGWEAIVNGNAVKRELEPLRIEHEKPVPLDVSEEVPF